MWTKLQFPLNYIDILYACGDTDLMSNDDYFGPLNLDLGSFDTGSPPQEPKAHRKPPEWGRPSYNRNIYGYRSSPPPGYPQNPPPAGYYAQTRCRCCSLKGAGPGQQASQKILWSCRSPLGPVVHAQQLDNNISWAPASCRLPTSRCILLQRQTKPAVPFRGEHQFFVLAESQWVLQLSERPGKTQ